MAETKTASRSCFYCTSLATTGCDTCGPHLYCAPCFTSRHRGIRASHARVPPKCDVCNGHESHVFCKDCVGGSAPGVFLCSPCSRADHDVPTTSRGYDILRAHRLIHLATTTDRVAACEFLPTVGKRAASGDLKSPAQDQHRILAAQQQQIVNYESWRYSQRILAEQRVQQHAARLERETREGIYNAAHTQQLRRTTDGANLSEQDAQTLYTSRCEHAEVTTTLTADLFRRIGDLSESAWKVFANELSPLILLRIYEGLTPLERKRYKLTIDRARYGKLLSRTIKGLGLDRVAKHRVRAELNLGHKKHVRVSDIIEYTFERGNQLDNFTWATFCKRYFPLLELQFMNAGWTGEQLKRHLMDSAMEPSLGDCLAGAAATELSRVLAKRYHHAMLNHLRSVRPRVFVPTMAASTSVNITTKDEKRISLPFNHALIQGSELLRNMLSTLGTREEPIPVPLNSETLVRIIQWATGCWPNCATPGRSDIEDILGDVKACDFLGFKGPVLFMTLGKYVSTWAAGVWSGI